LGWNTHSWKGFTDSQQIIFKDIELKDFLQKKLSLLPNIVNFNEITNLNLQLTTLKKNNDNFIIHLGECSESFANFSQNYISGYNKLFADIALSITHKKLIKIARLAGQFAKPRSELFETINNKIVSAYRGDLVNEVANCNDKRVPNLNRWIEGYSQAAITKSLITKDIFISHESLLLEYEENFLKQHSSSYYTSSAHLLWVGKRTTFLNSAHIEFVRGLINPIAFKVSHENIDQIAEIISKREADKKTIIIGRFGLKHLEENLNIIVKILKKYPHVIYLSDPMHGNTENINKQKYRLIPSIKDELLFTINYFKQHELKVDGVMLEATHEDVLECVDNKSEVQPHKYKSYLDPRLNYQQTLEVIKLLSQII
jgi:3-deoxy-7-phosphoheptulonate synthase